jgi:glycosidase
MVKIKIIFYVIFISTLISSQNHFQNLQEELFSPPEWSYNQTIYEVNIRQFTEEGTFNAFSEHLPKLKEMGIGIIWLMPIHPIGELNRKGTLGSYYSVKNYRGINEDFGSEKDFKNLIREIHKHDMHVIIDWVANHTAWDHPWTKFNKEFYTLDSLGNFVPPVADWSDVIDLNYDNQELQTKMIEELKYWVSEFDIDGYRCDVAAMVPHSFWKKARLQLNKIKPVFMLAEAHEPEFHENGFDMTYAWELKDLMNSYAKGTVDMDSLKNYFLTVDDKYPEDAFKMNFTTNHDENSWNGTVHERLGNLVEPFSVLFSTASGMPLVYSGQEAGLNKALEFFEKDKIEWNEHPQRNVFAKIFNEKKNNKAMWNGCKGGKMVFFDVSENKNILAFYREMDGDRVVVLINLSDSDSKVKIGELNLFGVYKNLFLNEKVILNANVEFELNAYNYLVFVK